MVSPNDLPLPNDGQNITCKKTRNKSFKAAKEKYVYFANTINNAKQIDYILFIKVKIYDA